MKTIKNSKKVDAIVVGAGFSGLYLTHLFRKRGLNVQTIEAADDVGGTWYWNRYPGARCDVQSVEYSFSFSKEIQEEWNWSEKYSPQPEILKYTQFVADKLDLKKNILFNTKVTDAVYNEEKNSWKITTDMDKTFEATYFIMATGCLSVPRTPNFKGMENFKGEFYHTGNWPHNPVDFRGKKVGIIGTGSSGIQSIPVIAETAKEVTVFVKDSNYTLPSNNGPLAKKFIEQIKEEYDKIRHQERYSMGGTVLSVSDKAFDTVMINQMEDKQISDYSKEDLYKVLDEKYINSGLGLIFTFADLAYNEQSDEAFREYLDDRIRRLVKDPKKAEILIPKSGRYYDRRPVMDTKYYETFNKDNVDVLDVNIEPIVEFTEKGIKTTAEEYEYDVIVCATGFDAMTGAIDRVNIVGKDGVKLKDKWSTGPRMYLGLMSHGFPNLFTVTGPGSPSVLSNMMVSIEQHVEWIDECIKYMQENEMCTIEADLEAENNWVDQNIEMAKPLFIAQGNSWYVGANVPGKPRVIMPYVGGVGKYRIKCEEVVKDGYKGFAFTPMNATKKAV